MAIRETELGAIGHSLEERKTRNAVALCRPIGAVTLEEGWTETK